MTSRSPNTRAALEADLRARVESATVRQPWLERVYELAAGVENLCLGRAPR